MSRLRTMLLQRSSDDGQLLLLILIYTVIAGLLVTIVVNLSSAYLYRRSLVGAADGAALTAANQPDLDRIYADTGAVLPLSADGTRAAVRQYVRDADLERRFNRFRVIDVRTDGATVTVTLSATIRFPMLNLVSASLAGGYDVDATARATSLVIP